MAEHQPRVADKTVSWDDLYVLLEPDPARRDAPAHMERLVMNVFRKLEWYFLGRGFAEAEDLAQTTILRVAARCREIAADYAGDRTRYFLGFARNIAKEAWKDERKRSGPGVRRPPEPDPWHEKEILDRCLTGCVGKLEPGQQWIVEYYEGSGTDQRRRRQTLARELGRTMPGLRTAALRIRNRLEDCVQRCAGDMDWFARPDDRRPGARPDPGVDP